MKSIHFIRVNRFEQKSMSCKSYCYCWYWYIYAEWMNEWMKRSTSIGVLLIRYMGKTISYTVCIHTLTGFSPNRVCICFWHGATTYAGAVAHRSSTQLRSGEWRSQSSINLNSLFISKYLATSFPFHISLKIDIDRLILKSLSFFVSASDFFFFFLSKTKTKNLYKKSIAKSVYLKLNTIFLTVLFLFSLFIFFSCSIRQNALE